MLMAFAAAAAADFVGSIVVAVDDFATIASPNFDSIEFVAASKVVVVVVAAVAAAAAVGVSVYHPDAVESAVAVAAVR